MNRARWLGVAIALMNCRTLLAEPERAAGPMHGVPPFRLGIMLSQGGLQFESLKKISDDEWVGLGSFTFGILLESLLTPESPRVKALTESPHPRMALNRAAGPKINVEAGLRKLSQKEFDGLGVWMQDHVAALRRALDISRETAQEARTLLSSKANEYRSLLARRDALVRAAPYLSTGYDLVELKVEASGATSSGDSVHVTGTARGMVRTGPDERLIARQSILGMEQKLCALYDEMFVLMAIAARAESDPRQDSNLLARAAPEVGGRAAVKGGAAREWASPSTGMRFVWIPALNMWVGKYEVTNAEYRRMDPQHRSDPTEGCAMDGDLQPAAYRRFDNGIAFARWLTDQDRASLPSGHRYRLPTENEWMVFAQCGDMREHPWGDGMPPKYGNYHGQEAASQWAAIPGYNDGFAVTCDVQKSGKNDWGLYGVGGNVWEMVVKNDAVDEFAWWLGGSWGEQAAHTIRCSYRGAIGSGRFRGFRLVLAK